MWNFIDPDDFLEIPWMPERNQRFDLLFFEPEHLFCIDHSWNMRIAEPEHIVCLSDPSKLLWIHDNSGIKTL